MLHAPPAQEGASCPFAFFLLLNCLLTGGGCWWYAIFAGAVCTEMVEDWRQPTTDPTTTSCPSDGDNKDEEGDASPVPSPVRAVRSVQSLGKRHRESADAWLEGAPLSDSEETQAASFRLRHGCEGFAIEAASRNRLLRHGQSSEAPEGWTPLLSSCDEGTWVQTQGWPEAGATPDEAPPSEHTALMLGCFHGHLARIQALLSAGDASVDATDHAGWTALMYAVYGGHADCAAAMILAKAWIEHKNDDGFTALMLAVQHGHTACMHLLLRWGAAVDVRASEGETPLIIACQHGRLVEVMALLEAGAEADAVKHDGFTALMAACQTGNDGCVQALIEDGSANVNYVGKLGFTAIMLAAAHGHTLCAQELVRGGAEVERPNVYGWTAMMLAQRNNHKDCTALLAGAGALRHCVSCGTTDTKKWRKNMCNVCYLRDRRVADDVPSTAPCSHTASEY